MDQSSTLEDDFVNRILFLLVDICLNKILGMGAVPWHGDYIHCY
jgi:hypothetical protein